MTVDGEPVGTVNAVADTPAPETESPTEGPTETPTQTTEEAGGAPTPDDDDGGLGPIAIFLGLGAVAAIAGLGVWFIRVN